MRSPSTLAFMLRWSLLETIAGVVSIAAGIYLQLTNEYSPPPSSIASQVSSPIADLATYVPFGLVIVGIAVLSMAWNKASNLRNGGK